MRKRRTATILWGIMLIVSLSVLTSCNLPTRIEYIDNPEVETKATAGALTLQASVPVDEEMESPAEPEITDSPQPTHLANPDPSPPGDPQVIHDQESDRSAPEKQAYGGDEYNLGRYERPFDQDMSYIPAVDIYQVNLFRDEDNDWVYTIIRLKESPIIMPEMQFSYGIELDLDIDGRGDVLVWTAMPQSSEWSFDGVTVWKDLNESVGGKTPMRSDPPPGGDGYEAGIFESGVGEDPDLAWSRINPDDNNFIEIAFKKELLEESKGNGEVEKFMWAAWANVGVVQLDLFDHNDHFTKEEAGSPLRSEEIYYPLKAVHSMDNTCRAASGFAPTGSEPGLCPTYEQPGGEPGPSPTDEPGEPEPPLLY